MEIKWYDIVILLMIFQLSMFTFYLLHKGRNNLSNRVLAAFFITQIIGILDSLIFSFSDYFFLEIPFLVFLGSPIRFLWAPLMYIYVKSLVYCNFSIQKKHILHLIPFLVLTIFFISKFHIYDIETKISILSDKKIFSSLILKPYFLYVHVLSYNLLSVFVLERFKRKLKNEIATIENVKLSWLKFILYSYVLISIFNTILCLYDFGVDLAIIDLIIFLSFLAFFTILFYKAIINPNIFVKTDEYIKYRTSPLTERDANIIIEKLNTHIKINKSFLEPNITIKQLADELEVSDRFLSQIINEYKKQNFYDFINCHRVRYAMKILSNSNENNKTVLEVLYEAGFNSKSAFNVAFKKITGTTPSQFRKEKKLKPTEKLS